MLNPFLHSKMDFKQQKIVISCKFMSSDSDEKKHFVEQLDKPLEMTHWCLVREQSFALAICLCLGP
jgi:hypothetical protein